MNADSYQMPRIYTRNDPTVLRVFPPLAQEIGLNESILLLQLDFLISISKEDGEQLVRDGKAWTRQSLRHLRDLWFPFWSPQTIARALWKLRDDHKLITVTDKYNKHDYDKSQWFALNPQGFRSLNSVTLHMVQLNGTGVFQIGTGLSQDGTTIPETLSLDPLGSTPMRENDDYQALLNAVCIVCKMLNALMLKEKDYEQVDILYQSGVTPEQIRTCYEGRDSWWFTAYWKGRKAQFPSPADLVETIGKALAFKSEGMEMPQPAGNQRKPKIDPATADYLRNNPQPSGDQR